MPWLNWIVEHGSGILGNAGIIGGLLFTGHSIRLDARARRLSNLVLITAQHRDIWSELFGRPELARVLSRDVDLAACPPTVEEGLFVKFLIFHLAVAYRAASEDFFVPPERMADDIREFLSLPIPASAWARLKPSQDSDFVSFVEAALREREGTTHRWAERKSGT